MSATTPTLRKRAGKATALRLQPDGGQGGDSRIPVQEDSEHDDDAMPTSGVAAEFSLDESSLFSATPEQSDTTAETDDASAQGTIRRKDPSGDAFGSLGKYGRPLSIIESVFGESSSNPASEGSDEDGEAAQGASRRRNRVAAREVAGQMAQAGDMNRDDDLEAQISALFSNLHDASANDTGSHTIKLAALPDLLASFERHTGIKLLDDDMQPQVRAFAEGNADVDVEPEQVVAVIRQLQTVAKEQEAEPGATIGAQHNNEGSTDDESSVSGSDSGDEGQGYEDNTAHTTTPSRQPGYAFPRSQSDRHDLSHVTPGGSRSTRKPTTSDPATPNAKLRRSASGDRDVLKGRGKARAPPSAWSRPKPQAIAARNRKSSDASGGSSFENSEYDQHGLTSPVSASASPRSGVISLGRPAADRLSSQPFTSLDSALSQIPGSPSAKPYSFPRAQSPLVDDMHDAEAQERWNALSVDLQGRDSGCVSPEYDQQATGSPAKRRPAGSRRSSGASRVSRRRGGIDEYAPPGETMASLQAQVEGLQRLLAEKRHNFEQMQQETEEYISRLQEELDRTKSDLSLKRKEETLTRIRENNHLDVIAGLEADLNKANRELESIKTQYARLKSDHDGLVDAMERHTSRNIELRDELTRAGEQKTEHMESEKQWDDDRESYRNSIKSLNEEIADLQDKLLGRDEDARVIASLQANIDALTAELEEVRSRGSSILGRRDGTSSNNTTLSKRLGNELARSGVEEEGAETNAQADEEGEASADSIVVIHRRKRAGTHKGKHSSQPLEYTDGEAQTEATIVEPESSVSVGHEAGAPPTYSEASMEKSIVQRLHPEVGRLDALSGISDPSYRDLVGRVGMRCVQLEGRLRDGTPSDGQHLEALDLTNLLRRLKSVGRSVISDPVGALRYARAISWRDLATKATKTARFHSQTMTPSEIRVIFLLLVGCVLLYRMRNSGASSHDQFEWDLSNNLAVPWSSVPGGDEEVAARQSFLARLLAISPNAWRGYRVPT